MKCTGEAEREREPRKRKRKRKKEENEKKLEILLPAPPYSQHHDGDYASPSGHKQQTHALASPHSPSSAPLHFCACGQQGREACRKLQ